MTTVTIIPAPANQTNPLFDLAKIGPVIRDAGLALSVSPFPDISPPDQDEASQSAYNRYVSMSCCRINLYVYDCRMLRDESAAARVWDARFL